MKHFEARERPSRESSRERDQRLEDAAADREVVDVQRCRNVRCRLDEEPIEETTEEEYRRVIEINQLGCFSSIKHSIAPMKQAGAGSIILISSTAGIDAVAGIAAYTSSKFAVKSLARVAALELGRSNIRVNTVHPGPIDTAMSHWGGHDMRPALAKGNPMGRIGTPREVAEVVAFLASDASSYCTGGAFSVDGGETAGVFVQYDDPTAQ